MAVDVARPSVEIRDFQGMVTGVDLLDIPAGAATEQVNCICIKPGELRVRRGLRPAVFDTLTDLTVVTQYLLLQDGGFLLQENGDKIIL